MRTYAFIVATFVGLACSDGSSVVSGSSDTRAPDTASPSDTVTSDEGPTGPTDTGPLGPLADLAPSPEDPPAPPPLVDTEPQPEAWSATWTRWLAGDGARVLGLRYLGGQGGASLIAVLEVGDGAALVDDDGDREDLPGEGHRLIALSLGPNDASIVEAHALSLGDGEEVVGVTKAPNGFALALASDATRVVVAQVFSGALRVAELTLDGEGSSALSLPPSADVTHASSGGASTSLALQITVDADATLAVVAGEARLELPVHQSGVAFLTLPGPTEEDVLPGEGAVLAVVPELVASAVVETSLGPVVVARAAASTTVLDDEVAPGDEVLLIGAVPDATSDESDDDDGVVPVVLWAGDDSGLEVVQVASSGGGLLLAGIGQGSLAIGEDAQDLESARAFVASLGAGAGFIYTAPACDGIFAVSGGFNLRILRRACDVAGQGAALVLTLIGSDFSGEVSEPFDLVLAPVGDDVDARSLAGMVSFSTSGGRAYGGLFDLGEGPRVIVGREDGQVYDSGVIAALAPNDAETPLHFHILRQGGGGGGGNNPTNNAVLYASETAQGWVLGRARIDFRTYID